MKPVYLDIETIPCQSQEYREDVRKNINPPATIKKPESILKWMDESADTAADELIAKTSFDPAHGHICCLSFAIGDEPVRYYEARKIEDERHILERFFSALPKMGLAQFIGHNIAAFDLRFVICRAIVLGVKIPTIIPRDIKPWSAEIFDTMTEWAGARGTISQDRLAKALGIPGKDGFDGSMVAEAWAKGEYDRISTYCMSDVETVRKIHKRFVAAGY